MKYTKLVFLIRALLLMASIGVVVYFALSVLTEISRIEFRRYRLSYTLPLALSPRDYERWEQSVALLSMAFSPTNMQYTFRQKTNLIIEFVNLPSPEDLQKFEETLLFVFFEDQWHGPLIRIQPLMTKKRIQWVLFLLSLACALGVGFEYIRGKIYEPKV